MNANSQARVHLRKCAIRLAKEVEDYAFAEFSVDLVLVHLEDLLKGRRVDGVLCTGDRHNALDAVLSR